VSAESPKLTGHHRTTLDHVFAHPMSHNVEWHAVVSLLNEVASVTDRDDGNIEVRTGERTMVITKPHKKDVDPDELVAIRHLLESLGYGPR
jgi:hypothetical protein